MIDFFFFIDWAKDNPSMLQFIQNDIASWIFISFFFGFLALLLELNLPLKYYWQLPGFLIRQFLLSINKKKLGPQWGFCLDRKTKQVVPVSAVELIDARTKQVIDLTYSSSTGRYGFNPLPGQYFIRAIKNYYRTPSILDPENVQLVEVKESYTLPVKIGQDTGNPQINLELQPTETISGNEPHQKLHRLSKNIVFALGNAFLILAVSLSLFSWAVTKKFSFGILISVSVILLFIKIYILEIVRRTTKVY